MNDDRPEPTPGVPEILARAAAHGLQLTTDRQEVDGMGLDFVVLHARDDQGTAWVVRCPRRPDVVAAAITEGKTLALLAPRLPVAIPDWRVHAPDVIAYPRLPGQPALTFGGGTATWAVIDPAAPDPRFLESCALFLAALQAVDPKDARRAGLPVRTIPEVRARWARTLEEARPLLAPTDASWARWQGWIASDRIWPEHVALSNGDLHPGHMLLDESTRLTGVLDWTEAAVGDPGVDLAMFFGCFGQAPLSRLCEVFARAGGRVWPGLAQHAADQWFAFPAHAAAWAARTSNPAALEFARHSLRASEK